MEELLNRIIINPHQLTGKPAIRGMRISVEQVLNDLAKGMTAEEIIHHFPILEEDDIKACLLYAARMVESETIIAVSK